MPGVFLLAPGPVFIDPNQQTVQSNATVTASGSTTYTDFSGVREIVLVINIKNAPTGTTPTLQYTLQEIDPGDGVTAVGTSVQSVVISTATTEILTLPLTLTGSVKVSWTVTGTTPSFTGVYTTLVTKITTVDSGIDSAGTEHPLLVDTSGRQLTVSAPTGAASQGLSLITDPTTGNQTANYSNSAAPAVATLSNTTAGYTTLGGLFEFAAPAGAETDYALFAYQVPTGYHLYVDAVRIDSFISGFKSSTVGTVLQWALAANSSAVSLATGGPNPPIRTPLGVQQASKAASVGDAFLPVPVTYEPDTPVVISPTRYFHVILRVPIGNATPGQFVRGTVHLEGYFQAP